MIYLVCGLAVAICLGLVVWLARSAGKKEERVHTLEELAEAAREAKKIKERIATDPAERDRVRQRYTR